MFLETNGVSREFKESVKCVSSVFQENFNKKFQGCFKNVSRKFSFAIFFSHVPHRSYPSRRRACLFCFETLSLENILQSKEFV